MEEERSSKLLAAADRKVSFQLDSNGGKFWKGELKDAQKSSHFPSISPQSSGSNHLERLTLDIGISRQDVFDKTLPLKLQLAWALSISQYTMSPDVIFGFLRSGRAVSVGDVHSIASSNMSIVPLAMHIQPDLTVIDSLAALQQRSNQMIHFDQYGLQRISQLNEECKTACQFQNLLVVQPEAQNESDLSFTPPFDSTCEKIYPLTVVCQPISARNTLTLEVVFDPDAISRPEASWIVGQFGHLVDQVFLFPSASLDTIMTVSVRQLEAMRTWNAPVTRGIPVTLHGLLGQQLANRLHRTAVMAWDGNLQYQELESLSHSIAVLLQKKYHVGPGSFVPVYATKSKWTLVAVMAIMKAGGAFCLLANPQPSQRLVDLVRAVQATVIISTTTDQIHFPELDVSWLELTNHTVFTYGSNESLEMGASPDCPAYIMFTSGSTGNAKGIVIPHIAIATNALIAGRNLLYTEESRVLHFASYAFDVSIAEIFYTLMHGGCVLIPKESEMRDNLPQVVSTYCANKMAMTPSLLRSLNPYDLPSMRSITVGGETPQALEIERWSKHVILINSYGPAECAVNATANIGIQLNDEPGNIGRPHLAACWVVSKDNPEKQVPIGAIGELLIEGPIVGIGYLNDCEKSAAAFIEPPSWLKSLRGPVTSSLRCYRTGDLVKYSSRGDGSLVFIGRKDNQVWVSIVSAVCNFPTLMCHKVKLRGQRVELGEVEYRVRRQFKSAKEVVVDVISPAKSNNAVLTAFIYMNAGSGDATERRPTSQNDATVNLFAPPGDPDFLSGVIEVQRNIRVELPGFMIPGIFLPLRYIPYTATGKIDRRALRESAAALSRHDLQSYQTHKQENQTPGGRREAVLKQLLADILRVQLDAMRTTDHFFHLGGDSISAMRLCGEARLKGFSLTVDDVFNNPQLNELAATMREHGTGEKDAIAIPPFALLAGNYEKLIETASTQCSLPAESIQDIYPCTPMQEALFALSLKQETAYVAHLVLDVHQDIDPSKFRQAWLAVVQANPILRTRLVHEPALGTFQVVQRASGCWDTDELPLELPIHTGSALISYGLQQTQGGPAQFHIAAHHALYDALSLRLILKQLHAAYEGQMLPPRPFNGMVRYIGSIDLEEAKSFWVKELGDSAAPAFPRQPATGKECTGRLSYALEFVQNDSLKSSTLSTVLKLAWALTVSQYTGAKDVVFGTVSYGRGAPVPEIEHFTGPTLATVPIRITVERNQTVQQALENIQEKMAKSIPYEQVGLHKIQQWVPGPGSEFQNLLVIQTPEEKTGPMMHEDTFYTLSSDTSENTRYGTYPLTVLCTPERTGVRLSAIFDADLLNDQFMGRIMHQVLHNIMALNDGWNKQIKDLQRLNAHDRAELQIWNSTMPEPIHACLHELVARQTACTPDSEAICSWDGRVTYDELDQLSSALAAQVAMRGIGPGVVVSVYIPRSLWLPVVLMGVLKAGAAFLILDVEQSLERLRLVCGKAKAPLVVCLASDAVSASGLCPDVLHFDPHQRQQLYADGEKQGSLCSGASPDDLAYVVFTSGSTGEPKGAMISHRAFCTTAVGTNYRSRCGPDTRSILISSLAFDVCISTTFCPLISGGCVCIPQDITNIPASISQLRVNTVKGPSTILRELQPDDCPGIQKIITGGETPTRETFHRWAKNVLFFQAYGPAECAVTSAMTTEMSPDPDPFLLGKPLGCRLWVVDPDDHECLVPIGAIGELVIEGPIVGLGYINDPGRSATAFARLPLDNASDLGPSYVTGDLVQYTSNGQVRFVGRQDGQVKINGQRVELGEIEHQIQQTLPKDANVTVDVVRPKGETDGRPLLAAFLSLKTHVSDSNPEESLLSSADSQFQYLVHTIRQSLANLLPRYMVPSAFVPLLYMPYTANGKTDRRRLREAAAACTREELIRCGTSRKLGKKVPTNDREAMLRRIYASVLGRDAETLGIDESFLDLGGDSILAIKLVLEARRNGIRLSVADIFRSPLISDLAATSVLGSPGRGSNSGDEKSINNPNGSRCQESTH